ncbi:ciliogenesis-associated TTC17-interacting protein-like [Lineus longissimus]|uniref:ciliogenesis-associated TTC17-interacting protein-like n=1 Tax=Lineus longissimus TaxID=88925 RepID=UPI002B4D8BD7
MSAISGLTQSSLASEGSQIQMHIPEEPPKSSEDALEFISSIGDDDFRYLVFGDSLVTTSDTGKEVGEFTVTIEPTKHKGEECFLIHANSHGIVDTVPCGTSITAYVSKKLETLEQQHHEYVKLENLPLDRKTFIVKQNDGYVVNKVITQGEDEQRMARTFKHEHMEGFISEGSNLLLQRLLVRKCLSTKAGVPDNLQFTSFDSDTNLCSAVYKTLEERKQFVGDDDLEVVGVERTINSLSDLPTTWQSYFTLDGHLSNRVQVGSPVTMKLVRVPTPVQEDEEPPKPTFDKQPLNWEEDMQLYSKFLDRKEELKGDHAVYMRHHPELRALLADFLQFLLLRKPDDVLAFAAEYFASFSAHVPNSSPYLNSTQQTPFGTRTNTKVSSSGQKP